MTETTRRTPAEDDAIKEGEVLRQVIELHPTLLTESELLRLMGVDPCGSPMALDALKRAIRELRRYGLLRIEGEVVAATLAALYFAELFDVDVMLPSVRS
jgi:hypothetical protein